jgi:hypothetical protein
MKTSMHHRVGVHGERRCYWRDVALSVEEKDHQWDEHVEGRRKILTGNHKRKKRTLVNDDDENEVV